MRRLVPALAVALVSAACTVPVFNPGMSASVATLRASHLIGSSYRSIGPDMDMNGKPDFDLANDILTFMPERWAGTIDPTRGFIVRRREYDTWNQIWYQWWDGSRVKWLDSPAGYNEEDGLRWRWPVTLKNGSSLGTVIFDGGDFETWLDRLWADTIGENCNFSPAHPWCDLSNKIKADLSLGPTPVVVGLSVSARDLPAQDKLHVMIRDGLNFSEAETLVSDTGFTPVINSFGYSITLPNAYPLPFLGTPRHLTYARDSGQERSFAQWKDGDGWHTGAWKGSTLTPLSDIDNAVNIPHRIDAALTTSPIWGWPIGSYLLSIEKQVGRVYHYNGIDTETLVAEFGLGTLRFIGEMYVDGEWQLLFSRSLLLDREADTLQVRFEILGIYTRDLLNAFGL